MLNRSSPSIRHTVALAAVAILLAGCADSRLAANNAANQSEQPYSAGYGLSSAGTTTDLYTEFFGSSRRDDKNAAQATATASATPPQVQPVTAAAPQPAQPATKRGQPATASAPTRLVQPAPAATEVAQQPAAPQAPPEPDVPVAYGITANGPTTDLYTELFGPRRRDGQ